MTHVTQSADHGVNVSRSVMLLQLDNFDGIVLFATNLAENFDPAFVRRILVNIKFELPDLECRKRLWQYLLPNELPRSSELTFDWLAENSEQLSGGDILNTVIAGASRAVERQGEEKKIFQKDIKEEIEHILLAKKEIGISSEAGKGPLISYKETELNTDDESLPPKVQEKLRKRERGQSN